ncbi:hypothetical protein [Paenibacillus eucommiae]|uniref:Uncharacterized protein n=1 Tax=Paenibacillus eucommiae TaxID=1355755 RepID=A0ABS4JBQ3_9BACL|nr:hypothetical protein [Paenibacillus eucommiae]MBP1996655.1 hypothetical protein [Paenibacillus eucommiae]
MKNVKTYKSSKMLLMLLCGMLILVLAACGNDKKAGEESSSTPIPTVSPSLSPSTSPALSPIPSPTTDVTQTPAPTGSTAPENEAAKTLKGEGSYTGQEDSHTVEITMNGEPTSFQFGDDTAAVIDGLKKNDHVEFEYIVSDPESKQLTLTKIVKK